MNQANGEFSQYKYHIYEEGKQVGIVTETITYERNEEGWKRNPPHDFLTYVNKHFDAKDVREEWIEDIIQIIDHKKGSYPIGKRLLKEAIITKESPAKIQERTGLITLAEDYEEDYQRMVQFAVWDFLQKEETFRTIIKKATIPVNPKRIRQIMKEFIEQI